MKASKLILLTLILLVTLTFTIGTDAQPLDSLENSTGINRHPAAEDLLLQLYVDKGAYNAGEEIFASGKVSLNGFAIVGAQVCISLFNDTGGELWGACMLTDIDGWFAETLSPIDQIPEGYSGTLILVASADYEELHAESEMYIPYGTGSDDDDDDDEPGVLTLSYFTYDKVEFTIGDDIQVGMEVTYDGLPLADGLVCPAATDEVGNILFNECIYTDANGKASFQLGYLDQIPSGYSGYIYISGGISYSGLFEEEYLAIPYLGPVADLPIELQLWGPATPIQIGGWDVLQLGGTVTSQGSALDGATVSLSVAGGNYQTTTGQVNSGEFYYGWPNDTFPAGEYVVQVTVTAPGYLSASGTIPFTVFGAGYDFAVVMDSIQAVYDPDVNVPFTGTLTLGGASISDWIETEVTYPDGSKEIFINQTEADGRFTVTIPSLMEPGGYQLAVFYSGDRKQISPVYTFSVGAGQDPDEPPVVVDPPEAESDWSIINVTYPKVVILGETITLTGTLVTGEGENQVPLVDIPIQLGVGGVAINPVETWETVSGEDGTFTFQATLTSVFWNELGILALKADKKAGAVYYDSLEIMMSAGLTVSMDRNSYKTGERVSGTVEVLPAFDTSDNWFSGMSALIQIIGPSGSNEKTYLLGAARNSNSGYAPYGNTIDFWWVVPEGAEAGSYRVEVIVSSPDIVAVEGSATFSLEEFHSVNFKANFSAQPAGYDLYKTPKDPFYPGRVYGKYSDHNGLSIDKADVRIIAVNTENRTQKVELKTTTDQAGEFELTLEQLNCLAGSQKSMWELTVYADKEGYSTGADVVYVETPVALPRVEIIEADPLTNDLELQSFNGRINYTKEKPYTIRLKVKYTACDPGTDLWVKTRGDWALKPEKVATGDNGVVMCGESTWNQAVSINGSPADPIGYYDLWDSSPWTNTSWSADIWRGARHETLIPLEQGIGKEIEVTLSGNLFNFKRLGDKPETQPERCVLHTPKDGSPTVPPDFGVRVNLGDRGVDIDMAVVTPIEVALLEEDDLDFCYFFGCTGIDYPITKDKGLGVLFVSGAAWVGVGDGNIQATVKHGFNARLINHDVRLQAMVKIENPGPDVADPYEPTDLIKVPASVRTDDVGHFSIPLAFEGDPCEHMDKTFVIKVSTDGFEDSSSGNNIIVNLRCEAKLDFSFDQQYIDIFQAADLTGNEPIILADRKATSVRVTIEALGEIYKEADVEIKLRGVVGGREFTQKKIIYFLGPKRDGEIYIYDIDAGVMKKADILEMGTERVFIMVDFVFTPEIDSKSAPFEVEITLDEAKRYGDAISEKKTGEVKRMKGLSLMFVPYRVDTINLGWVLKQVDFVRATYPIDKERVRIDYDLSLEKEPRTLLLQIASNLSSNIKSNASKNEDFRVVGMVDPDSWNGSLDYFWGAEDATGAWFGIAPNIVLLKYEESISEHVLAHELGHSYGLYVDEEQYGDQMPLGDPIHGLMVKNGVPYDIPTDYTNPENTNWVGAFGLNSASEQALIIKSSKTKNGAIAPVEVYDIMGAADGNIRQRSWISAGTYRHLLGALADPPDSQVLNIQGKVYQDSSVQLDPVWTMEGLPDSLIQALSTEIGEYDLQLRSGAGEVLSNTKFGVVGLESPFSFSLSMVPGAASVVVSLNGTILGELTRSAAAPIVEFSQAPVLHGNGMLDLYWGSNDPDGDILTYGIQYRCSQDETWLPIRFGLDQQTCSLNTSQLSGGGSCTARVLATDGFNTASAVSQPFSVPTKAPSTAIITEPTGEPYQNPVRLEGATYDPEYGFLPEDRMTWSSDLDGEIGIGSSIEAQLSPGEHTITLVGEDAHGMMSRAMIQISVSEPIDEEPLTGMGSGLQSLWFIGFLVLAALMGLGSVLILWLVLRKRKEPAPAPAARGMAYPAGGQQGMTQDNQGRWWYQDPNTGAWSIWNGTAWQSAAAPQSAAPPQRRPASPTPSAFTPPQALVQSQPRGGSSCLFTIIIFAVLALIVLGGITLVAFNFFPGTEIQPGTGDLTEILKMGGGGLLVTVLGGLLLNGGLKSVITRRAVVEDEWGRRREKRGCSAVLNGLGSLAFGVLLVVGGLGLMGLAIFQEVLPYLGI